MSLIDTLTRSQSGRIIGNTLADGASLYASRYRFDAAGRLIEATIPGHSSRTGSQLRVGAA